MSPYQAKTAKILWKEETMKLAVELGRDLLSVSRFDSQSQEFVDAHSLADAITRARIGLILHTSQEEDIAARQALIDFIRTSALRAFATAVRIGLDGDDLYNLMRSFKDAQFKDNPGLPIYDPDLEGDEHRVIGDNLNSLQALNFGNYQFTFSVPILKVQNEIQSFHEKCILPFTSVGESLQGNGGFSDVFDVKVHDAHIDDPEHSLRKFAVKKVKSPHGEELSENDRRRIESTGKGVTKSTKTLRKIWEAEARALQDVGKLNNPHIVKLIAAFTRGDDCCFMFELAEGGTLRDYWERNPKIELTTSFAINFFEQLRGLGHALYELHNYKIPDSDAEAIKDLENTEQASVSAKEEESLDSIRHGDLKPANILVFPDLDPNSSVVPSLGTLKIADLGLAKRHVIATRDRKHGTSTRYGSIQYTAPEASIMLPGAELSRLYDMWSIGCIALEFLIWMLYGEEELKRFNASLMSGTSQQESPFFKVKNRGNGPRPEVHPQVIDWMDHMGREDPACREGTAIGELLAFIKTRLLVVELPRIPGHKEDTGPVLVTRATSMDTTTGLATRATAKVFLQKVDDILNKVRKDRNNEYLKIGKNRDEIPKPNSLLAGRRPSTNNLTVDAAAERAKGASTTSVVMSDGAEVRESALKGLSNVTNKPWSLYVWPTIALGALGNI